MQIFDLAVSYIWKYDLEFVNLIEKIFQENNLKTFIITSKNLEEVIKLIRTKKIFFKAYLDRASDEDPKFRTIAKLLRRKKCYLINPHDKIHKAIHKAHFHKKLLRKKFNLPKTIILPCFEENSSTIIKDVDLKFVGVPFIIKPALFSGGGYGVVKDGTSIAQVQDARIKNPKEDYLIQEKIIPRKIDGKRAWFRIFYVFGNVIPTWWDDITHLYQTLSDDDLIKYKLQQLIKITKKLVRLSRLDYFSTEIAVTKDHKFVLIDYINDQCDMRLQSKHVDGVPDSIVHQFILSMKDKIISL